MSSSVSSTSSSGSSGSGTPQDLFTTVPVDLFRAGNASGPRLDNIRDKDVPIKIVKAGDEEIRMVSPEGGISTFGGFVQKQGVKWWKIPKATKLPPSIRVVKDNFSNDMQAFHYSLQPARLMTLLEYAEGLRELAKSAIPMFTQPINSTASSDKGSTEAKANVK